MRTMEICGQTLPAIGIGMWSMGAVASRRSSQLDAMHAGIKAGARAIDTAEMYGNGTSEEFTGRVLREVWDKDGIRPDDLFVIDKVLPSNARPKAMRASLERSLRLLGRDSIDLYLLHWRSSADLSFVAQSMHDFRREGLIRHWGVSNFDLRDMEDLLAVPYGDECEADENLYNVATRGMDYDLLPWLAEHKIPLIAYSPLGSGGAAGSGRMRMSTALGTVARRHRVPVQQVELAWAVRDGRTLAIPQTGNARHMTSNIAAAGLELSDDDLALIDEAFPRPTHKVPLAKL